MYKYIFKAHIYLYIIYTHYYIVILYGEFITINVIKMNALNISNNDPKNMLNFRIKI